MKAKRLIALLLCAMMLVSLLPAAVFADEAEEEIVDVFFGEEEEETLPAEEPVQDETIPEETEDEIIPEEDEEIPADEESFAEEEEIPAMPETEDAGEDFDIRVVASGKCGFAVDWELLFTGELLIGGIGAMNDYTPDTSPWYPHKDSIKRILIGDGVTKIGACAFYGCSNLTSVDIPGSVTVICDNAFTYCSSITGISLPEKLQEIGYGAFYGCSKLAGISFPASLTTIGESAFKWCSAFTEITVPANVTSIGSSAFSYCENLKTVVINASIEIIPLSLFQNDPALKNVSLPRGLKKISEHSFKDCNALETVAFAGSKLEWDAINIVKTNNEPLLAAHITYATPDNACGPKLVWEFNPVNGKLEITGTGEMYNYETSSDDHAPWYSHRSEIKQLVIHNGATSIGSYAFYSCSKLAGTGTDGIVIPSTVKHISGNAFYDCTALKSIKFLGNAPYMDEDVFRNCVLTAYYPAADATWTSSVMKQYAGTITWKPYGGHPVPVMQIPANHENYMIIQWSKCEGATGYRLQYREGSGPWTEVKVGLTQVNSKGEPRWDYNGAKDGLTYTFMVYADFADGTSTQSERVGQMRLRTPKIKVSHFGGSDSTGGFRVDWEATTGGSQYKIYYREKGGSWALYTMIPKTYNVLFTNIKASITNANPALPNLVAGHTYEFMVLTCTSVASVTSGFPTPFVSMKF